MSELPWHAEDASQQRGKDWQVKDRETGHVVAQFVTRADAKQYVEEMDERGLYGRFRIVSVREPESYKRQAEAEQEGAYDYEDSDTQEWIDHGRLIAGRYSN